MMKEHLNDFSMEIILVLFILLIILFFMNVKGEWIC